MLFIIFNNFIIPNDVLVIGIHQGFSGVIFRSVLVLDGSAIFFAILLILGQSFEEELFSSQADF